RGRAPPRSDRVHARGQEAEGRVDAHPHERAQVAAHEAPRPLCLDNADRGGQAALGAAPPPARRDRARRGRRRREGRDRRSRRRVNVPPRPMLATLSPEVVTGPEWVFEEKYDGIRAIATRQAGAVRLWSRMLQDLTAGFPEIVAAVGALPDGDLAVDGELVSLDEHGVSRFQLLQRDRKSTRLNSSHGSISYGDF